MLDQPAVSDLCQAWPRPSRPLPVVVIGAGAIVRTSHLPAYRRLGLPIGGLFDLRPDVAAETARLFEVSKVFAGLDDACAATGVVFDLAVPGDQVAPILERLPAGAAVLIQKPMGQDLDGAREILRICRERRLIAAVNLQLRFSPNILSLGALLVRGTLGAITDIDVRIVVRQPWEQWSFLRNTPRLEVLYHSIHYLDTIRHLAGEPKGVYCRAVTHPSLPEFSDARSSIILDYGDSLRCSLLLNHTHQHDMTHRASYLKVEGTQGAAMATMGVNLEYPTGLPDRLEVVSAGQPWREVPLRGSWFTEAFEGPMSNLQRFVAGEDAALVSPVADACRTMAVVEACYESSRTGGTPIPSIEQV